MIRLNKSLAKFSLIVFFLSFIMIFIIVQADKPSNPYSDEKEEGFSFPATYISSYEFFERFKYEVEHNSTYIEKIGNIFHVWNENNDYYINDTGIQITNHYNDYWTHNVWCIWVNTSSGYQRRCSDGMNWTWTNATDGGSWVELNGTATYSEGPYSAIFRVRYYLADGYNKINVSIGLKNTGQNISDMYFGWLVKDIRIGSDEQNDIGKGQDLSENWHEYNLSENLSLEFNENQMTRHYQLKDNSTGATVDFWWDSSGWKNDIEYVNIPFRLNLTHSLFPNQFNTPVMLLIHVGNLNNGSTAYTNFWWVDTAYERCLANLCAYYRSSSISCSGYTTSCTAAQYCSGHQECSSYFTPDCTCVAGYCAICGECSGSGDNCGVDTCGHSTSGTNACASPKVCNGLGTGSSNCVNTVGGGSTCYCDGMCTSPNVCYNNICNIDNPVYSNLKTNPLTPTTYDQGRTYQFNSTWTDESSDVNVLLEFNQTNPINGTLQNYTVSNQSNEYYKAFTDLKSGIYVYKWYGNDSSNNFGSTITYSYNISKNVTTVILYLNTTQDDKYYMNNTVANFTATISPSDLNVSIGGNFTYVFEPSNATGSLINITTLWNTSDKVFNITAFFIENENRTGDSETHYAYLDVSNPSIYSFELNDTYININESVKIIVNATDGFDINASLVEIQTSGGSANYSLTLEGTGNYTFNFTSTQFGGQQNNVTYINITKIYINDTAGNMQSNSTVLQVLYAFANISHSISQTSFTDGNLNEINITANYTTYEGNPISQNCTFDTTPSYGVQNMNYSVLGGYLHNVTVNITTWAIGDYNYTVTCINNSYETKTSSGNFSISVASAPSTGGGGGGGGGCSAEGQKCIYDSNCCGGLICYNSTCQRIANITALVNYTIKFEISPTLLEPEPFITDVSPGAKIGWHIMIYNYDTEHAFTPAWEFSCTEAELCLASWCIFNNTMNVSRIAVADSARYQIICTIPDNADITKTYRSSLIIWPLETSKDHGKPVYIVIKPSLKSTLVSGVETIVKIPQSLWNFINYQLICFTGTCQDNSLVYVKMLEKPIELKITTASLSVAGGGTGVKEKIITVFDSIRVWHIFLIGFIIVLFLFTPLRRVFG